MSGGKGGSQSTKVEIPPFIEAAARENLNRAQRTSRLGYMPYYGPEVAAFTPMQQEAMSATGALSDALGLTQNLSNNYFRGMPDAVKFGGMRAYGSGGLLEQTLGTLAERSPSQFSQYGYLPTTMSPVGTAFTGDYAALPVAPPSAVLPDIPLTIDYSDPTSGQEFFGLYGNPNETAPFNFNLYNYDPSQLPQNYDPSQLPQNIPADPELPVREPEFAPDPIMDVNNFGNMISALESGQYRYGDAGEALRSGAITPLEFNAFQSAFNQFTSTDPSSRQFDIGQLVPNTTGAN